MAKVSVGLRGWRFEESDIFTDDGEFRPLDEMPADASERLVRLVDLIEEPCDACYLEHGDANVEQCRPAAVVYGEPMAEVVLCGPHERDFVYWYREAGGAALRGDSELRDTFHEWFLDGGGAPEGYAGVDHVETDPGELPEPPAPTEVQRRLNEQLEESGERMRIDILEEAGIDRAESEAGPAEGDLDVDLDAEYPSG